MALDSARRKAYEKDRYQKRKASGICVKCGAKHESGASRCEQCRLKEKMASPEFFTPAQMARRAEVCRALYHRRKAAGICVECGLLTDDGKTRCSTCRQNRKERNAYNYGRW